MFACLAANSHHEFWNLTAAKFDDSTLPNQSPPMLVRPLLATALACAPLNPRHVAPVAIEGAAEELFYRYAAAAPSVQSGLYAKCWDIVSEAVAATVPDAVCDASAFGGELEAFVTAGPDDPTLIPDDQIALVQSLSDTAASYTQLVDAPMLSWGTCYRTLNRPVGAFFCGISLWPRTSTDVPNFTLYFGSGSAVNPKRVFMRLEMIPRVDTDTDAGYAEKYYAPFNERFFSLLANDDWEPYISDSAYARGALAPSGLRYFFDGTNENMALAKEAVLELAGQWAGFMATAEELSADAADAIARRDAVVRRVAADSSPDNANRERVFGSAAFARTKALLCGELESS